MTQPGTPDFKMVFPWSEIDFRNVGCALCHVKDDEPMMFTIPPMDYPGMRDARAEFRLHGNCYALLTNIIGAALFTGIYGAGVYERTPPSRTWVCGDHCYRDDVD